jgi:hypothetical protein
MLHLRSEFWVPDVAGEIRISVPGENDRNAHFTRQLLAKTIGDSQHGRFCAGVDGLAVWSWMDGTGSMSMIGIYLNYAVACA